MSETNNQMPEQRQIRQVPVWANDAKIELTGAEFLSFQQFFSLFAEPFAAMRQAMDRNLNAGVVQIRYQDPEGKEIPIEEVEAYLKQMQEYFMQQATQNTEASDPALEDKKPLKAKKSKVIELTPQTNS